MKTLLIVDMQKGFINSNNEFLINKINELLEKNIFENIVLTKYKNKRNSPFVFIF